MTPDMWHLTHDTWHVTPDTWHLKCDTFFFFFYIGGAIRTRQEIQCLPYAGLFKYIYIYIYFVLYRWFYPHTSRDSVSPVCKIFLLSLANEFCSYLYKVLSGLFSLIRFGECTTYACISTGIYEKGESKTTYCPHYVSSLLQLLVT